MRLLRNLSYLLSMAALAVYLLNPTAGVVELIPDNLPVVGNLDEAAAVGALIALFRKWRSGGAATSEVVPTEKEKGPGGGSPGP